MQLKISTNKFYTPRLEIHNGIYIEIDGAPYSYPDIEPLIEIQGYDKNRYEYSKLYSETLGRSPIESNPYPSPNDYQNQYFDRYFLVRSSSGKVYEVNAKEFKNYGGEIRKELYRPLRLRWYISGNLMQVSQQNKTTVEANNLQKKISNFIQYYR